MQDPSGAEKAIFTQTICEDESSDGISPNPVVAIILIKMYWNLSIYHFCKWRLLFFQIAREGCMVAYLEEWAS